MAVVVRGDMQEKKRLASPAAALQEEEESNRGPLTPGWRPEPVASPSLPEPRGPGEKAEAGGNRKGRRPLHTCCAGGTCVLRKAELDAGADAPPHGPKYQKHHASQL